MIFACIDYFKYIFRKGNYSHEKLIESGLFLADNENYEKYSNMQPGTVIFVFTLNSFISWIIMYVCGGIFSHVMIFYSKDVVFDCTTKGVHLAPLQNYFDGRHYLTLIEIPDVDPDDIRSRAQSMLGAGYAYFKVFKLGLSFISGVNPESRWALAVDFSIFLGSLAFLFRITWNEVCAFHILIPPVGYLIIYSFNRCFRQWEPIS
jgi:hypothetical protein